MWSRRWNMYQQFGIGLALVTFASLSCYVLNDYIGFRAVALILLLTVSFSAMILDIFPVLLTAFLSALIWNFFFIPPVMTLRINSAEDGLMFLMYFAIASINAVLTHQIRQLEEKQRDKEEKDKSILLYNAILNSLSHELKTPIATIVGSLDIITENKGKLEPATIHELHDEMAIAGNRLHMQVNNLLNMSRVEAGVIKAKPDWTDVEELLYRCITYFKEEGDRIEYQSLGEVPLLWLDEGLVEQCIINLLQNASRHTPAGTGIHMETNYKSGVLKLVVSDEGPGFKPEEVDFVFDKFYKIDKTSTGGTGLGLSIVKGLVRAMEGSVDLNHSGKFKGAEFTIKIPCKSAQKIQIPNE
ncbi:MAG: PAS domain-containing sensor histidine kinase [Saprospiraceae bacterium]|nr:PAS domain-containing sensor histidine kinase [Saprospiraceae bacterium]